MRKATVGIACDVLEEKGNFKLVEVEAPGHVESAYLVLQGHDPVSVQFTLEYAEEDFKTWTQ